MPDKKVEVEQADINDICTKLGQIYGKIDSIEKQGSRTTLALIGVIAAQIGVKVLGTPILLDIATVFGIIGAVLLAGVLLYGVRRSKARTEKLTRTGWFLVVMLGIMLVTQVCVYFRDLGMLPPNAIYTIRIIQNLSMVAFAWQAVNDLTITKPKQ